MQEKLYAVNYRKSDKGLKITVIATLEKNGDEYIYKPQNLDKDDFPRAESIVRCTGMPALAARRLYSRRRPDIKHILNNYGLSHYDAWELLKRTKGKLATDNIMYLSKEELELLKTQPEVLDFIGVEESATSVRMY